MTIPSDHLRACPEHRLIDVRDHACPACAVDATAKPDAVSDRTFTDMVMRQQIEEDTLHTLMPLLEEEADRVDGEAYVAVAEVDPGDEGGAFIGSAAGYTVQERWFNVAVIECGPHTEVIGRNADGKDAIEVLEAGDPLVEKPEYDYDRLAPGEWEAAVAPHVYKRSTGRVNPETLAIVIGSPSEHHYSLARKALSVYADMIEATVRTVEKREDWRGNVEALIEVTI